MHRRRSRRRFLAATAGLAAGAGCLGDGAGDGGRNASGPADGNGTGPGDQASGDHEPADPVALEPVATGIGPQPVAVAFARGADRRYVAERRGMIHVHDADGGLHDAPLLDLSDRVLVRGEAGLLGIALHPDFPDDPRLFVRYSADRLLPDAPSDYSHTFVLASFEVGPDGLTADPASEVIVLEIAEPYEYHNAGDLAFGPDGMLYVGVGDSGHKTPGFGHADDWYPIPGGNGQDVEENLLGSLLRIDVDETDGGSRDRNYGIPSDNPLVGREGLDEHYAWGLRNPWRLSFDPEGSEVDDGPDLYVADVGAARFEEIDLVQPGGNYGWNVREGRHCLDFPSDGHTRSDLPADLDLPDECPTSTPPDVRGGEPLRDPIIEYPHDGAPVSGIAAIGGYRYRGDGLTGLRGDYVFGDWQAGDRLFAASPTDEGGWETRPVPFAGDVGSLEQLVSFGRDPVGQLYVLGKREDSSGLFRIIPG